ncbi:hypothetical protein P9112_002113 [Eukaryota sp. TZLM1-RC]
MDLNHCYVDVPLTDPTAIHSCCFARVLPHRSSLICLRGTYLDVYSYPSAPGSCMELTISYNLFQEAVSVKPARLPSGNVDVLILAFEQAKVSVVGIGNCLELITVSLHSFEHLYDLQDIPPIESSHRPPLLAVDPSNRCAALLLHNDLVCVIPLTTDDFVDLVPEHSSHLGLRYPLSSFHFSLHSLFPYTIDFCFLPGLTEPCIAVAYQKHGKWPGDLTEADSDDTSAVAALAIDLSVEKQEEGCFTMIWVQEGLTGTITSIAAVKQGGVVMTCAFGLVYCSDVIIKRIPMTGEESIRQSKLIGIQATHSLFNYSVLGCDLNGNLFAMDNSFKIFPVLSSENEPFTGSVFPSDLAIDHNGLVFISSKHASCPLLSLTSDTDVDTGLPLIIFDRLTFLPTNGGSISDLVVIDSGPFFGASVSGFQNHGNLSLLSKSVVTTDHQEFEIPQSDSCFHVSMKGQKDQSNQHSELIVVSSIQRQETLILRMDQSQSISIEQSKLFKTDDCTVLAVSDTTFRSVIQVTGFEIRVISPNFSVEIMSFSKQIMSACFSEGFLTVSSDQEVVVFRSTSTGLVATARLPISSEFPIKHVTSIIPPMFSSLLPGVYIGYLLGNGSGGILFLDRTNPVDLVLIYSFSGNLMADQIHFVSNNMYVNSEITSICLIHGSFESIFLGVLFLNSSFSLFKLNSNQEAHYLTKIRLSDQMKLSTQSEDLLKKEKKENQNNVNGFQPLLTKFFNLHGFLDGIYVPNPIKPYFIVTASSDPFNPHVIPRQHSIKIDGSPRISFPGFVPVPFVTKSSLFFITNSNLNILLKSSPGTQLAYSIVLKTLPLNSTPNRIAYLKKSNTLAVALESFNRHEVQLISFDSLSLLDRYPFQEDEYILSMIAGELRLGPASGVVDEGPFPPERPRREHLCVGTGYIKGEWYWSRGRIVLLLPELESNQAPNQDTRMSLTTVWDKEERGHVSALNILDPGYLVALAGPRLMLHYLLQDGRLKGIGFFDGMFYVTDICTIKNLICFGDLEDSTQLVQWKDTSRSIDFRSRDSTPLLKRISNVEFFIPCQPVVTAQEEINRYQLELEIIAGNIDKNFVIFCYDTSVDYKGGQMLKPVAYYRAKSQSTKMNRFRINNSHISSSSAHSINQNPDFPRLFPVVTSFIDGSIGSFSHVSDSKSCEILFSFVRACDEVICPPVGISLSSARKFFPFKEPLIQKIDKNFIDISIVQYWFDIVDPFFSKVSFIMSQELGYPVSKDQIKNAMIEACLINYYLELR